MKKTPTLVIRLARASDLAAINDIYNHYVLHSTCTYQEKPETLAGRRKWFRHHGKVHPVLVAVRGWRVLGWGSLSPYRQRSAYRRTVENSVYVHPEHQRRGIGSRLLENLIQCARGLGHHTILAGIDAEQTGSMALHAKCGFEKCSHLKQVGFKFGRWLDAIFMQLLLEDRHRSRLWLDRRERLPDVPSLPDRSAEQVRRRAKPDQHQQRDYHRIEAAAKADQLMQRLQRPTGG